MSDLRARIKPKRTMLKLALGAVLLVGLLLVIADILGVGGAKYLVATEQILVGDSLSSKNTSLVRAELGDAGAKYMKSLPPQTSSTEVSKLIARQSIGVGEFILKSSFRNGDSTNEAQIAVEIKTPLSQSLNEGSLADIFATRLVSGTQVEEPRMVASGVWIRKIETDNSLGRTTHVVDLSMSRLFLPEVLAAIARSDYLTLVESSSDE